MKASVRIMRSYDYCQFEVCLESEGNTTLEQVNNSRKDAARLVDEAVRQYQVAKLKLSSDWSFKKSEIIAEADKIRLKPVSEWTPADKAVVKLVADENWETQWDYDDEADKIDNPF